MGIMWISSLMGIEYLKNNPLGKNSWFWRKTKLVLNLKLIPTTFSQLVSEVVVDRRSWK